MEKIKLFFIDSDLYVLFIKLPFMYPLKQFWLYILKIWLMNLELALSKILIALNTLIDDFDDRFLWLFGVRKKQV
jgi:hypothetical protein